MADLVTEELLDAIAQVESGGRNVIGDVGLKNKAYGAFQIRLPAYQDVIQRRPRMAGIPFERVQRDPALNRLFARNYLEVLSSDYGIDDLDGLIAAYNAGPTAVRRKRVPQSTLIYVNRVKRNLRGQ